MGRLAVWKSWKRAIEKQKAVALRGEQAQSLPRDEKGFASREIEWGFRLQCFLHLEL